MPPKTEVIGENSNHINAMKLGKGQNNFIDTINNGPDALDPQLFDGPMDRIMLGLKAHANTISHARLIALEETFPMTRESIGEDVFNQLSRDFVALEDTKSRDNALLGENFSLFLDQHDIDPSHIDLAAIEWIWLESYNAADADSLTLEKLSEFDEETLLSQNVIWHPSVRIQPLHGPISDSLKELREVIENPSAIMLTRPDVEVKLLPIDNICLNLLQNAKNMITLGNLLAIASETGDKNNPLQPLLTIIGAGALICMDT